MREATRAGHLHKSRRHRHCQISVMANSCEIAENLESKFELNDGKLIPAFGLGLFRASAGDDRGTESAVRFALEQGYHLVDTAEVYG